MDDQAIQAFHLQLQANPHDWFVRAHLAALLESGGDANGAAQVIMEAPVLPEAREHLMTAVRILTPVNPAAAMPYLQALGQAAGQMPPAIPVAPVAPLTMPVGVGHAAPPPVPALHAYEADEYHNNPAWTPPEPDELAGEVHLTERPKPRFGTTRFAAVVILHAALLVIGTIWVISEQVAKKKQELVFDSQPPRVSANRGTETAVKMAKKRSSSSAPASAKRVLAKNGLSQISLPEMKVTSPLSDATNLTATGMGGAGMGIGFGGTGGNGPGGSGMAGGGRGRFIGGLSMDSRCSKGDREKRIAQSGGIPQTEVNVKKSLDWLKTKQNADGSWGNGNKASMTGLALLAYLGHCETPDSSKDYGETVLKGITWLADLWEKKQFLSEKDPKSNAAPYEHGIATYALAEAYTMTRYGSKRIPMLREAVLGGIDVIVKGQDGEGGWNYGYGPPMGGGSDMSVSGWQIQAMNAAKHTGMDFAGLDDCMRKALDYVEKSQGEGGGFGYRGNSGIRYSMTGVACLALVVGSKDKGKEMRDGAEYISNTWSKRRAPFVYDTEECELYASYYVNQVAFMRGGIMWRKWNKALQDELLPNQNPDGSYKREGGADAAHGSEAAGGDADIYRTALCTLMLEVYYRYLPATEKHMGDR